jgi:hypothetical protein
MIYVKIYIFHKNTILIHALALFSFSDNLIYLLFSSVLEKLVKELSNSII